MSLQVVNGIPCFNCTDVENAKKGQTQDATPSNGIAALNESLKREFSTPNDPLSVGDRGRVVNFGT